MLKGMPPLWPAEDTRGRYAPICWGNGWLWGDGGGGLRGSGSAGEFWFVRGRFCLLAVVVC